MAEKWSESVAFEDLSRFYHALHDFLYQEQSVSRPRRTDRYAGSSQILYRVLTSESKPPLQTYPSRNGPFARG